MRVLNKEFSYQGKQGDFENFVKLFQNHVADGDWCMDIGANSGDSSFCLWACGAAKVICFEPIPQAFALLKQNVVDNRLESIFDLYNVAATNKYEVKDFIITRTYDNGALTDCNVTPEEQDPNMTSIQVNCVDIHDFLNRRYHLNNLKKIKFIKIDTEGYDAFIIIHLLDLIRLIKPIIVTEWWWHQSKNGLIFDAIEKINYTPLRSDNLQQAERKQFANKCGDLILIPNDE